ncbi:MAG: hypothetical protein ABH877_02070, partial [bacterium]
FRLDSIAMLGRTPHCTGCDALTELADTYLMADSMEAAERTARLFVAMLPESALPWHALARILDIHGRFDEAAAATRRREEISPSSPFMVTLSDAERAIRRGALADAEERLGAAGSTGDPGIRCEVEWWKVIVYRNQGRLVEALATAREMARCTRQLSPGFPLARLSEAIVLFESERFLEAASLFDSMAARSRGDTIPRSKAARNRAWFLTHEASALAAGGDQEGASVLADTIEALGPLSAYGRDRLLHYHVRGLIALAEGRVDDAEADLRRAIFSPTSGYTRSNLEIGRLLVAEGRPSEAIAVLSPALRGSIEASNLYVTRTELHELLARAFDDAGAADSAAVHYAHVVEAWKESDAAFHPRRAAAAARLRVLRGIPPRS